MGATAIPHAPGPADVAATVAAAVSEALAGIGDAGTFTLATLPNPATLQRRTIWCTDLWAALGANQGGRMVSEGGTWRPIRPLVVSAMAAPAADMTVQPFVMGTTLLVTGSMLINRTLTLGMGAGYAVPYAGYRQRVTRRASGLFTLLVNGVGLSLNGWADFEFDGTAWQQSASGGLL